MPCGPRRTPAHPDGHITRARARLSLPAPAGKENKDTKRPIKLNKDAKKDMPAVAPSAPAVGGPSSEGKDSSKQHAELLKTLGELLEAVGKLVRAEA